jgi:photosystem II stability/assembly factor-like uncharacterized protein
MQRGNMDMAYVDSGFLMKTVNGGITWTYLSSGTSYSLSSVYFPDFNTGYAAGAKGTILKTINGGVTWTTLSSGTTNDLTSVFFTDVNTGYVAGSRVLLKTIDGGITWIASTGITTYNLNSVCFADYNTGYAVGESGTILKTMDGGLTWAYEWSGTCNPLYSVYFTDANSGHAAGAYGTILSTSNGGSDFIGRTAIPTGSFKVYPNPALNKITVTSKYNIQQNCLISIYTISGELVKQCKVRNERQFEIDVSNLSGGMYLLKMQSESGIEVQKLVIQ